MQLKVYPTIEIKEITDEYGGSTSVIETNRYVIDLTNIIEITDDTLITWSTECTNNQLTHTYHP